MKGSSISPQQILQPQMPENSSVKLVGLGGVGGIVARHLAIFLASLGRNLRLVLIDGDEFEPSNANRMVFGSCGNKAAVTRAELLPRFVESQLSLLAFEEYLTPENMGRLLQNGDTVILCVDNHATRKMVNDFCATRLNDVCLVSGGNDGIEATPSGPMRRGTYGNVQIYLRRAGTDASPSLVRFHPELANPADRLPSDQSCTELVTSVPQILFTNMMVATAILNSLWLYWCGALHYSELAFDIAEGLMRPTAIPAPALPASEASTPQPASAHC